MELRRLQAEDGAPQPDPPLRNQADRPASGFVPQPAPEGPIDPPATLPITLVNAERDAL